MSLAMGYFMKTTDANLVRIRQETITFEGMSI